MNNKSINIKTVFYFLLLLPFFKPACIPVLFPTLNKIYMFLQLISAIIIFILILKKIEISKIVIYIILFEIILVISTYLNSANLTQSLKDLSQLIVLVLIVDYAIKYNAKEFIHSLLLILEILVYANFFCLLAFPNGMYVAEYTGYTHNWYLGYDNIHILTILPALMISYIYSYINGSKIKLRTIILTIISIISIFICWSATSVVGVSLFLLFIIFKSFFQKKTVFNFKNYLIIYIISFLSIIVFRIQNIFSFIIVDILKKDLTFTGRTYIWDYVIKWIKVKPMLGYGLEDSLVRYNKTITYKTFHAHNQFLEIIYKGGFFLISMFMIMLISVSKKLNKYQNNKISKLISWTLFIYLIMMLTEAYSYEYIFYIFVIAYNVEYLIKASKEVKPCEQKVVPKI